MTDKVSIVGIGNVATTTAFALLLSGLTSEIVLVETDRSKCQDEVMDLSPTECFTPFTRIRAGDFADCAHTSIIVLTAGQSQKAGQNRQRLNLSRDRT